MKGEPKGVKQQGGLFEIVTREIDLEPLLEGTVRVDAVAALDRYATAAEALAGDNNGDLDDVGGRVRVHELAALVPASGNAGHYARIVREMATLRGLVRADGVVHLVADVPEAGLGLELEAITIAVIGGTSLFGGEGTVLGTVGGAMVLAIIANVLNLAGVSPFSQQVVKGAIIVVAIIIE